MFCYARGEEVNDIAAVCTNCGCAIKELEPKEKEWGSGAIASLVLGTLILPLIGILFGVFGLCKKNKESQGATLLILGVIMCVFYMAVL